MSISRQRTATPYPYHGSCPPEAGLSERMQNSKVASSLGGSRLSDEDDSVLRGMTLVAGRPEVEDDEGNEQQERDVEIARVDVGLAGKDERVDEPAGGGQAADEAGGEARAIGEQQGDEGKGTAGAEGNEHTEGHEHRDRGVQ